MSKHNKVNPGTYTQAGRLSPDDTARELKKQREAGSPKNTEGGQFGENVQPVVTPRDKRRDNEINDEQNTEE
jgi:hypothetical protein